MVRRMTDLFAMAVIGVVAIPVFSQAPAAKPSFEVVSVKPNNSGSGSSSTNTNQGRFLATNVTVKTLMMQAYRLQDFQIIGGPNWISSDRFDIEAKPEEGAIPLPQGPPDLAEPNRIDPMSLMVQSMLEDRFQLELRRETRELPVFTLSIGKDGTKFKASADQNPQRGAARPAQGVGGAAQGPANPGPGGMYSSVNNGKGEMTANTVLMAGLVNFLSRQLVRPVIDKTELKGYFDFHLEWAREPAVAALAGPGGAGGGIPPPADPAGPSMFTAVQEQLGLKLESTKGPVEVLIIDSVQKPSEN